MITDIKTVIGNALLANPNLVSLLGTNKEGRVKIYQLRNPYSNDLPAITFFEADNADSQFADNKPYASQVIIQIDIWSYDSTSAIAGEVDKTMKSLGYSRGSAPDFYESDTKIFHKAMRFRNTIQEKFF